MRVLYVVGSNLRRNTSANISHNAYVQGLFENGWQVDILMPNSSWGEEDDALPIWNDAKYHIYNSVSFINRVKTAFKNRVDKKNTSHQTVNTIAEQASDEATQNNRLKKSFRNRIKKMYEFLFNTSYIYNLDRTWLKNAKYFKEIVPYDLIISNSSPASSHKLVLDLFARKHLTETRWIQIWEDPWFFDLYGGHNEKIRHEEHRLLRAAQEIFYVSHLTLEYQKQHFPDCATKMKHIPLPSLQSIEGQKIRSVGELKFGYFGDYYSKTRNLKPFYEAVVKSKSQAFIYGDSDLSLASIKNVIVRGRVTLEKLNKLQDETDVLVHLCNLKGGQIPGKIYHYSATTKPILFILDGTETEKKMIKDYFMKFNRYHFCENSTIDIFRSLASFKLGNEDLIKQPVSAFAPKQVIAELLR